MTEHSKISSGLLYYTGFLFLCFVTMDGSSMDAYKQGKEEQLHLCEVYGFCEFN